MRVGAFIYGAADDQQKLQRKGIRTALKSKATQIDWFVEEAKDQKRDAEDRPELQRAARFCRTKDATFALASLKGPFKYNWQALTWLKHQVEMYDLKVVVADDPKISSGSLHVLSAAADEQRNRIAAKSKAALDDIKRKLAEEKAHGTKKGRTIRKLGMHAKTEEAGRLGNKAQAALAAERDAEVWPIIEECLTTGMGYTAIARHLNETKVATPAVRRREARDTLGIWYASTVLNIVLRQRRNK